MALLRFDEIWPTYARGPADEALLTASCSPKLLEFRRVISDLALQQGRKVVVFSQWRKMLRLAEWAIRDLLDAESLQAVFFTGEESQHTRTRNIVDFHDDANVRVMFLSDAGGVGLNLQRAASVCINLELPWNPAVLEQRVGRIYRLGQTQPIDVINLVNEYGIEARIAALIGNKKALFAGLFDGTTDTVRFDAPTGFLKDIERLVEPIQVPVFTSDSEGPEDTELDSSSEPEAHGVQPEAAPAADFSAERVSTRADGDGAGDGVGGAAPLAVVHQERSDVTANEGATTSMPRFDQSSSMSAVSSLLQRIAVTRTKDGGLHLEAPPDAAEELLQLLQGLTALVSAAAQGGSAAGTVG
jgi:superfamily II DNA/RNA helicase